MVREFSFSIIVTLICLALATFYGFNEGGWSTAINFFIIASILGIMELSLSFDNAVVNATVLQNMTPVWQQRFLTWGILIAVFGMRFIFPILIVAIIAQIGFFDVITMALQDPMAYSHHLEDAHIPISAFGGCFLSLVALKYLMNPDKDVHWFDRLEHRLASVGRLDTIQVFVTGAILMILTYTIVLPEDRILALSAGLIGILIHIFIDSLTSYFDLETALAGSARAGFASFMYLEILDASFSLDGVIGAFAITRDIVVIAVGLTIGAVFVRSLTLLMVKHGTLQEYMYLEHGAHYGIAALATIMLLSMSPVIHIPEVLTGLIGAAFIGASFWSSIRHRNRTA